MIRKTIFLPDEAKQLWKQIKAQAALADKPLGTWLYEQLSALLKKRL